MSIHLTFIQSLPSGSLKKFVTKTQQNQKKIGDFFRLPLFHVHFTQQ
ncbi:MAG: hypothetical protein J6V99_01125 [Neisseriaceae bacterium]|nr:hypothetical protein [Neisseriaceae bacterium]